MVGKTDKELATEIAIAYIQSWNTSPHSQPMQSGMVPGIVKAIYDQIHSLPTD